MIEVRYLKTIIQIQSQIQIQNPKSVRNLFKV